MAEQVGKLQEAFQALKDSITETRHELEIMRQEMNQSEEQWSLRMDAARQSKGNMETTLSSRLVLIEEKLRDHTRDIDKCKDRIMELEAHTATMRERTATLQKMMWTAISIASALFLGLLTAALALKK